jgi:3'-5' exonuclease
MLENTKLENIIFLDVETAPQYPDYESVPKNFQKLWDRKAGFLIKEDQTPTSIYNKAGIYAEFGKIICISAAILKTEKGKRNLRMKSFYGHDELKILEDFKKMLNKFPHEPEMLLCAHNGKEFDFPYIARRMIINNISLPQVLNVAGKKPWEVKFLDTMELWKFGDYKSYTSLELLALILGIETPKDDIDGSMVADVYWKDKNLDRIVNYCQKDVKTVAQILLRFMGMKLLTDDEVSIVK